MMHVYHRARAALTRSLGIILLLFSFILQSNGNPLFSSDTTGPASISSFTPTSGSKGTLVTIFGSNFTGTSAVRFGGVLADTILFHNDTVIVAIVDTGATGSVSVTTPFGTTSKPGFTFIRDTIPDSTAAPVIKSFNPTSARKGEKVLIFGSRFTNASAVRFGGVLAGGITFKNDTVIIAIVGSGATGNVSVTTPFGTASKPGFTFIRDTIPDSTNAPVIKSFNPTSARKGAKVLIFGSRFTNASAVRFGGVLADSITFKNDTVIIAIVGAGATGNVSVTTPFGTASKPGFTFIRDTIPDSTNAPVIVSFNPTSAHKGDKVLIFGSKFTNASAVRFGGVLADTITFKNDSVIIAIVGAGASGNVSVTTPFGTASKPGFTFIPDTTIIRDTPVIFAFSPTSGRRGTMVTILGQHFTLVNAVRFGGIPADSIVVLSDTIIEAIVDTGATGAVTVISPFGSFSKPGFTFIQDTLLVYARKVTDNMQATDVSKNMALYPNPASGYVIWQHPSIDRATHLQLFDITGRIVRNIVVGSNATQTTIAINGLNTGVYKLVWNDGKNKVTRTLLIK